MESKKYEDFENEAKQYKKILLDYKRTRRPFTDPNFHPTLKVKERKVNIDDSPQNWSRVDELCDAPLFRSDLIHPDYVQQGELGDCYFLAALSRIAKQPNLVPLLFERPTPNQVLGQKSDSIDLKCGAVVVYFNCFGRKTPVLIDTLLPTKRGSLRFSHPVDSGKSPWFCLVEKAYAKLNGSYSDIVGGTLPQAIYSTFGYYPAIKDFEDLRKPEKLNEMSVFDRIMKYQKKGAVMGTSINQSKLKNGVTTEEIERKGLLTNHCYLLLKAREHNGKKFFCLRNPWGDHEWNGDYSDKSPKWTPELKEGLSWRNADDGTFWMSDSDYFRYFTVVELSLPLKPEWFSRHFYVQLRPGDHDGYSVNDKRAKVVERPNFAFQVTDPIKKGDTCRFHILVEKRQKLYDAKKNVIYSPPKYCIVLAHSDGEKLSPEVLSSSNRFTMTSSNTLLCYSDEVSGNDDIITIVLQRLQKCDLIEDCYVHLFCEKDFKLYDVDHPDELIPEDPTNEIVFDNFSSKHPRVATPLKLKKIRSKEVLTFSSMSGNDFDKYKDDLEALRKKEASSSKKDEPKAPAKKKEEPKPSNSKPSNSKSSNSKPACYLVVTELKCKNLAYNGRPASDSNVAVQFTIKGKSYTTEAVSRNANPVFKHFAIPIYDLTVSDSGLLIDVLYGPNQNMKKLCPSMTLSLDGMEIDPLTTYNIKHSNSSGGNSVDLSMSVKLVLEKDLEETCSQSSPQTENDDDDDDNDDNDDCSGYTLEFTVEEAVCRGKEPKISVSLKSNKSQNWDVETNKKYQLKVRDPQNDSIFFIINDDKGNNIADTTFVRLAQVSLDSRSVLDTELSLDDDVNGHMKVAFTMKKH